jgi:hypothetical protein
MFFVNLLEIARLCCEGFFETIAIVKFRFVGEFRDSAICITKPFGSYIILLVYKPKGKKIPTIEKAENRAIISISHDLSLLSICVLSPF